MWTSGELKKLGDTVEDVNIDTVCTQDELNIIGKNSTTLGNLRNAIFVPKHNHLVML